MQLLARKRASAATHLCGGAAFVVVRSSRCDEKKHALTGVLFIADVHAAMQRC
ncbi:hypothetical protein VDS38_05585 [Xanthomonas campestris pv. campestris]|nr:hypothetical protein [Xanthomonas campestris pv. campestris]MEB2205954.1 hypothetical protein [Xanthomonas campestris pv. campestris]